MATNVLTRDRPHKVQRPHTRTNVLTEQHVLTTETSSQNATTSQVGKQREASTRRKVSKREQRKGWNRSPHRENGNLTNLLHSPPVTTATTPGEAHPNYGITLNRNEVSKYLEIYIGSALVKFPTTRHTSTTTGKVASDPTQLGRPNQLERPHSCERSRHLECLPDDTSRVPTSMSNC